MSKAIIDETTLSALGDAVRYVMSDDVKRTPGEMAEDLGGMAYGINMEGDYTFTLLYNVKQGNFGIWDFSTPTIDFPRNNATIGNVKFGSSTKSGANQNVTQVHFPDGTQQLATTAQMMFGYCQSLTDVSFPSGAGPNIASCYRMCYYCSALSSITLPDGFARKSNTIGGMFQECSALSSITLPDGLGSSGELTSIAYFATNAKNLKSLHLPSGVLGRVTRTTDAFYGCTSLSTITGGLNLGVSFSLSDCPLTHESLVNVLNSI